MRRWGTLILIAGMLMSIATPVNAAAIKPGSTCFKKNKTSTSSGKLYTCLLSRKKLVWNKGVAVKKPKVITTQSAAHSSTP